MTQSPQSPQSCPARRGLTRLPVGADSKTVAPATRGPAAPGTPASTALRAEASSAAPHGVLSVRLTADDLSVTITATPSAS